ADRDPAVQRAVRVAADADPGGRAHDHGHPGRRVLPRPTVLHARSRGHGRGEVTIAVGTSWPVIPADAWRRGIGLPCPDVGHPRVTTPMIDDGEWAGIPIGGMGSGSIGRTFRGDFARWHLEVGTHHFRPSPVDGFIV